MTGPALGTERIAAVELVLPSGTGVTLHVPDWDGEVGFLGVGDHLYLFHAPADLAAFLGSGAPNDLEEHPAWDAVRRLDVEELEPLEQDRYDLPAVTDALAEEPEDWDLDWLSAHAAMLRDLVDTLAPDLSARFAPGTPLGDLAISPERYEDGDDDDIDALLGAAVEAWDAALDAVDEWVAWPEPDQAPAAGVAPAATSASTPARTERPARERTFWDEVDLYPIELTLPSGQGWTLYTEVDSDDEDDDEAPAVFLGRGGSVELFRTQEGLAARITDAAPHDLTTHDGWPKVAAAAAELGDDLDLAADPADVYDLTAVEPALRAGPGRWDPVELRRGLELAADLADFLGRTDVLPAFDDRAPLGRVLASLEGDPLPPGVAGDAAEIWDRVLSRLDGSVRWSD